MVDGAETCVLVVDDDPHTLLALEALLSPHGHRLVRAYDGDSAVAIFESEAPDLVLCDLRLPGMDGVDVLARIRAHPERSHTPVVMITGYADREHRLRALQAGADEFVEKPIDGAVLLARLGTLLKLKRSRDALAARHARLRRFQREQRELVDFVAQEVSGPMRALRASVAWIQEHMEEGRDALQPALADMARAVERVGLSIDDLCWVSRLDADTVPIHRQRVCVDALVAEVLEPYRRAATRRGVTIDTSCAERLHTHADAYLLRRVLANILDNAIRYARERGRVLVEVRQAAGIEVRVHNDGDPIAPAERQRIFERFVRGATEPPQMGHGGLGLYFCKRAVEAHQGEIGVIDVPGWSTCFAVWLPNAGFGRLDRRIDAGYPEVQPSLE